MRRLLMALLLLMMSCATSWAADNAVILTPGTGVTMRTVDVGAGVQSSAVILGSTAGAAIYGTAGTANANVLTIQGIASGTTVPVTGTLTTVTTVTTVSTVTGGGVASAAADSGNPLKIGGKYNASPITLTDGNRGDLQLDVNGYVKINVTNTNANVANNADSVAAGAGCCSPVTNYGYVWNGSTWDRQVGTTAGTKITAASGSIASGALASGSVASGAVASGAYASGAVASGAYASGSLASGAVVDITNISATTAGAVPSKAVYLGVNVGGNIAGVIGDPCQTVAKTYTPITITTATTTRIVAPAASKKTYICYMLLTAAAADNVGIVEGTGGTCGSGTVGVIGGATAANGPNFTANGGLSFGNGGYAAAATAGTNVDLCLITSASTPLAGHIAWVQQ